jgi:hypothetical protein
MIKNTLLATLAVLSFGAAAQNGYWDYREVCDYEQKVTTTPITKCHYAGWLYIQNGLSADLNSWDRTTYGSSTSTLNNHVQCSPTITDSSSRFITDRSGRSLWAFYAGTLSLNNQTHTTKQTTSVEVVPGSCRTERVWIPLCENCQIP